MITKYIKGDIRDTELNIIAHGVNCQNAMGSGVAKALFDKWLKVKTDYHSLLSLDDEVFGSSYRLGSVQVVNVDDNMKVINMFTQNQFGGDGKKYVNYDAIFECFSFLDNILQEPMAIPKIGCGLAGGDWEIVELLINKATPNLEVWVYEKD